jgi:hypothetical protein
VHLQRRRSVSASQARLQSLPASPAGAMLPELPAAPYTIVPKLVCRQTGPRHRSALRKESSGQYISIQQTAHYVLLCRRIANQIVPESWRGPIAQRLNASRAACCSDASPTPPAPY